MAFGLLRTHSDCDTTYIKSVKTVKTPFELTSTKPDSIKTPLILSGFKIHCGSSIPPVAYLGMGFPHSHSMTTQSDCFKTHSTQ